MLIGMLGTSIGFVYNQAQPIHEIEKVGTVELEVKSKAGHREQLKAHFIAGDDGAYADEALLELLLTYAIPQRDVQPLAKKLLATLARCSHSHTVSSPNVFDAMNSCQARAICQHRQAPVKEGCFRFGRRLFARFPLVALHSFVRSTEFVHILMTNLCVVWARCFLASYINRKKGDYPPVFDHIKSSSYTAFFLLLASTL
jgi:hypothetical protein